jgi:CheY-like chemotaxis protein
MSKKTILLAEDDPGHEVMFRRAIERSSIPCHLEVVHDGVEALEYLFRTGSFKDRGPERDPDLILLDLKMPRMTGLQVLQVLRRVRGDEHRIPPVVVLTCSDDDEDVAKAYELGAQSYICKPLDLAEFTRVINETVEYWLGLNRPAPRRHQSHFTPEMARAGAAVRNG